MHYQKFQIPSGTILFHGSNEKLDWCLDKKPSWFSHSEAVAQYFSSWHGKTPHSQIHHFQTTEALSLLRICSRPHLDQIVESLGLLPEKILSGEDNYEGLLHLFDQTQTDGWIILGNYPEGDDLCLHSLHKIEKSS